MLMQPEWTIHAGDTPPKPKHKSGSLCDKGTKYHERVYRTLRRTDLKLHVEPWLRHVRLGTLRQPDAVVLLGSPAMCAIVIEVKMNWRRGRDQKLRDTYLQAVKDAFGVKYVVPLMIVQCVRGAVRGEIFKDTLTAMQRAMMWQSPEPTPVLLMP